MIQINPSPTADSRTAVDMTGKEQLLGSSVQHIGDVQKALAWFAGKLVEAGARMVGHPRPHARDCPSNVVKLDYTILPQKRYKVNRHSRENQGHPAAHGYRL